MGNTNNLSTKDVTAIAQKIADIITEKDEGKKDEQEQGRNLSCLVCGVKDKGGELSCHMFTAQQRNTLVGMVTTKIKAVKIIAILGAAALLWALKDVYDLVANYFSGLFSSVGK